MRFTDWFRAKSSDFAFTCLTIFLVLVFIALFGSILLWSMGWLAVILVLAAPILAVVAVVFLVYIAARWVSDAFRGVFRRNNGT